MGPSLEKPHELFHTGPGLADSGTHGLFDVGQCLLLRLSLADTPGGAGAFRYPVAIFTQVKDPVSWKSLPLLE